MIKKVRPATLLTFLAVERVRRDQPSSSDHRRRVDVHVYRFEGSDGEDYLKSFETKRGEEVRGVSTSTAYAHDDLNRLKIQWRESR